MSRFSETSRTVPARFPRIGALLEGAVLTIRDVAVPAFVEGKPVGPKVDPVTGETEHQVDLVIDANGVKTLVHTRGGIAFAIATELENKGLDDLHEGDYLSIKYTANEDMGEGLDPAKVFEVTVVPKGAAPEPLSTVPAPVPAVPAA